MRNLTYFPSFSRFRFSRLTVFYLCYGIWAGLTTVLKPRGLMNIYYLLDFANSLFMASNVSKVIRLVAWKPLKSALPSLEVESRDVDMNRLGPTEAASEGTVRCAVRRLVRFVWVRPVGKKVSVVIEDIIEERGGDELHFPHRASSSMLHSTIQSGYRKILCMCLCRFSNSLTSRVIIIMSWLFARTRLVLVLWSLSLRKRNVTLWTPSSNLQCESLKSTSL